MGDDEPRKNLSGLLAAHANYLGKGGTLPLVVAGRAAGGHETDPASLAALFADAAALVHASREEGFGLTILEAMATGTPVIAARNAAVEELTGDAALIVDEPGLADAMLQIDRDEGLRATMSEAGRSRAAEFTWQRSARAHIEAYTLARSR